MCLFEPIYGRYPDEKMCDSHPNCEGCGFYLKDEKERINDKAEVR